MQKTYDRQTAKFLGMVGENMPEISSDVMQGWIQNPLGLQKVLRTALCPPEMPETAPEFKVWKTIKLGTKGLKTADDFRKAIKSAGMNIGDWGNDILGKPAFTVSDTEVEVDLVNVSVGELGFKRGAPRKDIIAKALSLGLELCPNEVGPQLRLQYADQPKGEWLLVGMEPIAVSDGSLDVFDVAHDDDKRWLHGSLGDPDRVWNAGYRFVFVRSRK